MIVKICGIRSLVDLEIVERYADFGGIVVKSNSRRAIELDVAKQIIANASIPIFVVSTSEKLSEWEDIISKTECDFVQIHGNLPIEDFEVLKRNLITMKAFFVQKEVEIVKGIEMYAPHYILLDSGCGSGKTHDWRISKKIAERYPIILAGGLTVENVRKAIEEVKPFGVDVSSGVEKNSIKDETLISEFVRRAKNEIW
ncbi:MAG: phosphoribosylanthranilate isomerase [Archaeoglobaceae archaeon]|nr:phosphoribosylanthranilate isomerase [Archaeoglobaceae archaeon]